MKKVLFGFFGGIIFAIIAIYKFMTCTKEIKRAFVQAGRAWFGYAVFGDEYAPARRVSYRPYSYRDLDDYRAKFYKRKTEEGKKYEY